DRPCAGISAMKSRFLPYATTPWRLLAQLFSDVVVVIWTFIWVFVGLAVHSAVSTIAAVGRQVKGGADGVADQWDAIGTTWTPPRPGWRWCWHWPSLHRRPLGW